MASEDISQVTALNVHVGYVREQMGNMKTTVEKLEQKLDERFKRVDDGIERMATATDSLQRVLDGHDNRIKELERTDIDRRSRSRAVLKWVGGVAGAVLGALLLKMLSG